MWVAEALVGRGGWVRFDDGLEQFFVRFAMDAEKRLRAADLYIDGAAQPAAWITADQLRQVPVAYFEAVANSAEANLSEQIAAGLTRSREAGLRALQDRPRPVRTDSAPTTSPGPLTPPGPDGLTDAFLRQVAAAYDDAVLRRVKGSLYDALTPPGYKRRTVEEWVRKARDAGFLPKKGQRGRRG